MNLQPKLNSPNFECPNCRTVAQQTWFSLNIASNQINALISHLYYDHRVNIKEYHQAPLEVFIERVNEKLGKSLNHFIPNNFSVASCQLCNKFTLWVGEDLVYPRKTSLPQVNPNMDEEIKLLYQEAATIFADSPRGATALLRLALQKLLGQIGKGGKSINDDIKELVSEGLSPKIQQALDILRVVGNSAVHPGQIDLDDNSEVALKLFQILNFIADEMITKPKELEKLYNDVIPTSTKEHIKQRDNK